MFLFFFSLSGVPARSSFRFRRSSDMIHPYIMASRHYIQGTGQHIELFTMQGQHLSVNHHLRRGFEIELDAARGLALSQRMFNMRAVVEAGQIANQPQASDRSPTNVFDLPIT